MLPVLKIINLALILLFPMMIHAQQPEINEVRKMYFDVKNDCNALKLARMFEKAPPETALLIGYQGASMAASAECLNNPLKKLSSFKKGKQFMDKAIKLDPSNTEIRFLRFATQSKAPGFLGYNENLQEDKSHIIKNVNDLISINNSEIVKIIFNFLIESEITDQNDDKIVKDYLSKI